MFVVGDVVRCITHEYGTIDCGRYIKVATVRNGLNGQLLTFEGAKTYQDIDTKTGALLNADRWNTINEGTTYKSASVSSC